MELAVGAMGTLVPKLTDLLHDEFVAQIGLKREVESLCRELPMMDAALVEVSKVPPGQLSEPDKLWAQQVRELSYDMEDAVDEFMVRVARRELANATDDANFFKKIARRTKAAMKKVKDRHQISDKIKDIKELSKKLSELRAKYTFSDQAHAASTIGVDPRVINLHKNAGRELVGIEKARDELLRMLTYPEGLKSLKIVSIVGAGGLGKTTLAKVVHDQLKEQSFDCYAFVSVGRNPNITNTLREMFEKLKNCSSDKTSGTDMTSWTGERFCEELREFLQGKRYNIVVDDVWDKETWETISCALPDSNCGSKVIMTTRNSQVNTTASDVYKIKPLSPDKSKELFNKRTMSENGDSQLVDKILDKCDGVPLAIIAIASLLADRPLEDWQTVYESIIFGHEDDKTRTILLYSYYDLPPYLKPCLLYLSMYPEDSLIEKSTLIWKWIAEGFVKPQKERRSSLLGDGERYFDELLNRSMIQPAEMGRVGVIDGCRVHDIVLDLIRDLSNEENFVTILNEKQFVSSESATRRKQVGLHCLDRKVRRLSIQWSDGKCIPWDSTGMPEAVRSFQVIGGVTAVPPLSSFQACRLVSMPRVYIGDGSWVPGLSCSSKIDGLQHLLHLRLSKVPADRMGNLACLEELKVVIFEVDDFVVELGKLTRLRVLEISFGEKVEKASFKALVESLNKLHEIRELLLRNVCFVRASMAFEGWKPPGQLWSLATTMGLPIQLSDPSCFRRLRYLQLVIKEAGALDMRKLALLRDLHYLNLDLDIRNVHEHGFIVGAAGFENLRVFEANTTFKFLEGAMPRLESLRLRVIPERDLDFNLAALLSLKEVTVVVQWAGFFRGDVEETEAVLRRAVEDHPNRPTLRISRYGEDGLLPDDKMKLDKVVYVLLNARDCWDSIPGTVGGVTINIIRVDINMRLYRWLEEINFDIDGEGSRLSVVEKVEAKLRYQASRHPKRPKLGMYRINEDKMLCDDDDASQLEIWDMDG